MSIITDIAAAIDRQEGADQNNNPGNIWDGTNADKPNRIWPNLPIDSRGFVKYPTSEAGRMALEHDLAIKISRGMTLSQLLTMYAPPAYNDTATYIRNVSTWTGLPADVPLNALGSPAVPDYLPPDPAMLDLTAIFGNDSSPSDGSVLASGFSLGEVSTGAVLGFLAVGLGLWWFLSD